MYGILSSLTTDPILSTGAECQLSTGDYQRIILYRHLWINFGSIDGSPGKLTWNTWKGTIFERKFHLPNLSFWYSNMAKWSIHHFSPCDSYWKWRIFQLAMFSFRGVVSTVFCYLPIRKRNQRHHKCQDTCHIQADRCKTNAAPWRENNPQGVMEKVGPEKAALNTSAGEITPCYPFIFGHFY